jgi:hypothetical protein
LVIVTALRGVEAESGWITITRGGGVVAFEGPLDAEGRTAIAVTIARSGARVCVRLETLRGHRQAEIGLHPGTNVYAFS